MQKSTRGPCPSNLAPNKFQERPYGASIMHDRKLSCRRGTARCVMSVEILSIATQQCNKKLSYRRGTARCVVSVEICQLPCNNAETTCTTSPEQIVVMTLKCYSKAICNKHVHSTMMRSNCFRCPVGVINKPTTVELCISPVYTTTCCGEIF